ncbi:hypothetical protein PR048_016549 [Dryococelus australis]|uniref:RNA-directed DNA polymerase n=1 Tax=Dryococelus australis TaxID=614101 RepID=A0ABQ9HKN7_9NEOP|nr:hypothetical protein PR048_016549 [Dryococelus australis]
MDAAGPLIEGFPNQALRPTGSEGDHEDSINENDYADSIDDNDYYDRDNVEEDDDSFDAPTHFANDFTSTNDVKSKVNCQLLPIWPPGDRNDRAGTSLTLGASNRVRIIESRFKSTLAEIREWGHINSCRYQQGLSGEDEHKKYEIVNICNGKINIKAKFNGTVIDDQLYILPETYDAIAGRVWIRKFGLDLHNLDTHAMDVSTVKLIHTIKNMDQVAQMYPVLCIGKAGKIPDVVVSLKLRKGAEPVFYREHDQVIASDQVLVPYDPDLPYQLACDASPTGIAGVLSHIADAPININSYTTSAINNEVKQLRDATIEQISILTVTYQLLKEEMKKDATLSTIMKSLQGENTASLQSAVLNELHRTHVGITKMKQLARQYVYWKKIVSDIKHLKRHQVVLGRNNREFDVLAWLEGKCPVTLPLECIRAHSLCAIAGEKERVDRGRQLVQVSSKYAATCLKKASLEPRSKPPFSRGSPLGCEGLSLCERPVPEISEKHVLDCCEGRSTLKQQRWCSTLCGQGVAGFAKRGVLAVFNRYHGAWPEALEKTKMNSALEGDRDCVDGQNIPLKKKLVRQSELLSGEIRAANLASWSGEPMGVKYGSVPECKCRKTEGPRENLPTSVIIRHDLLHILYDSWSFLLHDKIRRGLYFMADSIDIHIKARVRITNRTRFALVEGEISAAMYRCACNNLRLTTSIVWDGSVGHHANSMGRVLLSSPHLHPPDCGVESLNGGNTTANRRMVEIQPLVAEWWKDNRISLYEPVPNVGIFTYLMSLKHMTVNFERHKWGELRHAILNDSCSHVSGTSFILPRLFHTAS